VYDTKHRLLGEYDATAKHLSKAVEDLTKLSGTTLLDRYLELKNAAEQWRMDTETARLALYDQVSVHKC
jgi:hypothetical protein